MLTHYIIEGLKENNKLKDEVMQNKNDKEIDSTEFFLDSIFNQYKILVDKCGSDLRNKICKAAYNNKY